MDSAELTPLFGLGAALLVIVVWRFRAASVKMKLISRLPMVRDRDEIDSVLRKYSRREGWIGTGAVLLAILCGLWVSWIGNPQDRPEWALLVAVHLVVLVVAAFLGHGLTRLEAYIAARVYAANVAAENRERD